MIYGIIFGLYYRDSGKENGNYWDYSSRDYIIEQPISVFQLWSLYRTGSVKAVVLSPCRVILGLTLNRGYFEIQHDFYVLECDQLQGRRYVGSACAA